MKLGGKCTSSHTTHIESANVFLKFAKKSPLVKKISLGIIKGIPHSKGGVVKRIKCIKEKACLLLKIRGNRAIQEIRFFSNNLESIEQEMVKIAKQNGFQIT